MYLRFLNNISKFVKDLIVGDGTSGIKYLFFSNGFLSRLGANPTAIRTWLLPDKSGDIALLEDINATKQYGKFTGLKSNYYLLGGNVAISPVSGGQSALQGYWTLQIGGMRAFNLYDTSFNEKDPPTLANIESNDTCCVSIQAQTSNTLAPYYITGLGSTRSFSILNIYGTTWHTNGFFLSCKNAAFTNIFNIDLQGQVIIQGNKILGVRNTGWTASTGVGNKGAFDTATTTLQQCAERIKALEDMCRTHGLIN